MLNIPYVCFRLGDTTMPRSLAKPACLYIELLCCATFCGTMDFFQVHPFCMLTGVHSKKTVSGWTLTGLDRLHLERLWAFDVKIALREGDLDIVLVEFIPDRQQYLAFDVSQAVDRVVDPEAQLQVHR